VEGVVAAAAVVAGGRVSGGRGLDSFDSTAVIRPATPTVGRHFRIHMSSNTLPNLHAPSTTTQCHIGHTPVAVAMQIRCCSQASNIKAPTTDESYDVLSRILKELVIKRRRLCREDASEVSTSVLLILQLADDGQVSETQVVQRRRSQRSHIPS
jgi:hypothetical protein